MSYKIPNNYVLYESSYGNDFSIDQYYMFFFKTFPSKYGTNENYDNSIKDYFISNGFDVIATTYTKNRDEQNAFSTLLINKKKNVIINVVGQDKKHNSLSRV